MLPTPQEVYERARTRMRERHAAGDDRIRDVHLQGTTLILIVKQETNAATETLCVDFRDLAAVFDDEP